MLITASDSGTFVFNRCVNSCSKLATHEWIRREVSFPGADDIGVNTLNWTDERVRPNVAACALGHWLELFMERNSVMAAI